MEIKRGVLKEMSRFLCIALLALGTQSCETEIPLEDNIPPEFSFRIQGAGFDHTFDQDFEYDNYYLRLKPDETYNITFSGYDGGGLKNIRWTLSSHCISVENEHLNPWVKREEGEYVFEWEGNRRNPVTGTAMTAELKTGVACISTYTYFNFEVSDFEVS